MIPFCGARLLLPPHDHSSWALIPPAFPPISACPPGGRRASRLEDLPPNLCSNIITKFFHHDFSPQELEILGPMSLLFVIGTIRVSSLTAIAAFPRLPIFLCLYAKARLRHSRGGLTVSPFFALPFPYPGFLFGSLRPHSLLGSVDGSIRTGMLGHD